ncbi:MAG: ATP-dependent DNA helicase, partial [[Ruminococcus] torques]
ILLKEEVKIVRISVRDLVEFVLREGDIDNRKIGMSDKDVMAMGGRLHRKIQRQMGSDYHAETAMKLQIPCGEFDLRVEGRADGVIIKGDTSEVIIDEIKGILRDLSLIEQPVNVHLAQAKCYAYIYAKQHSLREIGIQMTYCNLDTEEIRRFLSHYTYEALECWFEELISSYEKWARFQIKWEEKRNSSIRLVEFPFSYREGQREVAAAVYRTILRKKKLFLQAPTGVGKTISTLFPSVKAIGEGLGEKIFYLTAKTITRTVAEQAFRILGEQGLQMKVITLTAKEKICKCEETECNPVSCPYAKGHFDRVNDAVYDLIMNYNEITRDVIENQSEKYMVCPFEMSLDVSLWVDAVICDYNYAFDPTAHLKRFFSENAGKKYIFLVDEAHNLVERGREMYSARLYKEDFLELKKMMRVKEPILSKKADEVNRQFLLLKRECEEYRVLESVSHLAIKLMNLLAEMERFFEKSSESDKRDQVLELYFKVREFLNIHDILDENYVIYSEYQQDGRFMVKLFCVNPAVNLQAYLEYGIGTVFFSATLLPVRYYKKLLSIETDDYAIYADSPFPKDSRLLLIGRDVSTRYTQRGPEMYRRIASYIVGAADAKKGNYMVFFPSYRVMEEVHSVFSEKCGKISSAVQSPFMSEEDREVFLKEFDEIREESFVGFCVMGGIFSEGIDLPEDKLIGVIIVGTGLPQVCNEREIVKQYFSGIGSDGFEYAYLYPGMNKVLQSAGRVIRTEKDRGLILLLDERFSTGRYRELFPREWSNARHCTAESLTSYMQEFWEC